MIIIQEAQQKGNASSIVPRAVIALGVVSKLLTGTIQSFQCPGNRLGSKFFGSGIFVHCVHLLSIDILEHINK